MKKDPKVFLKHILGSIDFAEEYVSKTTKKGFLKSPQLQDAVIRRIEIMGEAAKNIPDDFKEKHHDVPWHKIEGMRNVLIHGYFGVECG